MNVLKNILSQWYKYVLWLLISVFLWGWIFSLLTDAPASKKLVLCVDLPELRDEALAETLSENRPEGIKLVAVHSFDYFLFDADALLTADLYIVGENAADGYIDSFLPLAETGFPTQGKELWLHEGIAYGIRVYDASAGEGSATDFINFSAQPEPAQDYFLFFGAESAHREDGKALRLAETLLELP